MEFAEGVKQGGGGGGGGYPFGGGVVDVVEDDVDANGGAGPAEAVQEVDRHGGMFVLRKHCRRIPHRSRFEIGNMESMFLLGRTWRLDWVGRRYPEMVWRDIGDDF